ncbi:MAG: hypothetical protein ACUVRZ_00695 [Desulfobacca sp.]
MLISAKTCLQIAVHHLMRFFLTLQCLVVYQEDGLASRLAAFVGAKGTAGQVVVFFVNVKNFLTTASPVVPFASPRGQVMHRHFARFSLQRLPLPLA